LSKLGVEDGINDGVEGAVDVAEPDEAGQNERIDATEHCRAAVRLVVADFVAYTDGVYNVHGEEWQPAEQKHRYKQTYKQTRRHSTPCCC